jgi:ADP-ribosyl-[dinitrogen reductase] hydrolase
MGSLKEFIECPVPEDQMEEVFSMPGGGPHNVGPGQVTDDSEMAMCLLWGLTRMEKRTGGCEVDMDAIASMYKEWIKSEPFDIGNTTADALEHLKNKETGLTKCAKFNAFMHNKESCSNGSMMRQTPLAVFGTGLGMQELKKLTTADIHFTHASPQ